METSTADERREKACTRCRATKPLDDFYADTKRSDGRGSRCKKCSNSARARRRQIGSSPRIPMAERFWQRVDKSGDCWVWTGYLNPSGYGQFQETSRMSERAHRTSWKLTNGPIPAGVFVCHRCDNPPCCNPAHLFLGTNADNMADKVAKGRQARGEKISKYSDAVVADVFRLASEGLGNRRIAKALGMSKNGVAGIRTGRRRAGSSRSIINP